jgi:hypothetical protein
MAPAASPAFGSVAGLTRCAVRLSPGTIWIIAAVLAGYGAGALLLGDHRFLLIYVGYVVLAVLLVFGVGPVAQAESE